MCHQGDELAQHSDAEHAGHAAKQAVTQVRTCVPGSGKGAVHTHSYCDEEFAVGQLPRVLLKVGVRHLAQHFVCEGKQC